MDCFLRSSSVHPHELLVGVGGIGSGIFFQLDGDHTLGRNESRSGRLVDVRDYCKLHIITHYVAALLKSGRPESILRILPVGKVGDDSPGHRLLEEMAAVGLDTRFVQVIRNRPTLLSVCFQYPDGSGGNITTGNSAASLLSVKDIRPVESIIRSAGNRSIVLAAPEVSLGVRQSLLELGTRNRSLRAASFTSTEMEEALASGLLQQVDLLAINEDEAGALVGGQFDPGAPGRFLDRLGELLRSHNQAMKVVLSAGKFGAFALDSTWDFCPAFEVEVASTAGAGDALFGGVIAGLVSGMSLPLAVELGTLLAAFSVTSPHTIHPDANLANLIAFAAENDITLTNQLVSRIGKGTSG